MNIIPCEIPTIAQNSMSGSSKEPRQSNFQLWVDLYELIQFEPATQSSSHNVFIKISQGSYKQEFPMIPNCKSEDRKKWVFKKKVAPLLQTEFPENFHQIPDIFIDIYCNKGDEPKERHGFIRLKAKDVCTKTPTPQWQRIRSPYNDVNPSTLGQLMVNVQFLRIDPARQPDRIFVDKGKKQKYNFFYQIISGMEICTQRDEEELNTRVEISVGDKAITTKSLPGRYP